MNNKKRLNLIATSATLFLIGIASLLFGLLVKITDNLDPSSYTWNYVRTIFVTLGALLIILGLSLIIISKFRKKLK